MMSFLDLRNATEKERTEIEDILTRRSTGVELPLDFNEPVDSCNYDGDADAGGTECGLRDDCKPSEEIIAAEQLSILSSGHEITAGYMPAYVSSQSQSAVYEPKRAPPIITPESYKGHYYPPAFGPPVAISSKPSPDSMKVPFYSSPPHFAPVITSISHVTPTVGSSAAALSPTAIAVVTSSANSIVEENDNRVPVTGNSYPMQAAFPHPYTGNPYIPSHGATLPMPPHMAYPVYFPVQFPHQFYAPLPQQMTPNHAPRHQAVNRSVTVVQNGSVANQLDNGSVNGSSVISEGSDNKADVKCDEDSVDTNTESEVLNSEQGEHLLKCVDTYVESKNEVLAVEVRSGDIISNDAHDIDGTKTSINGRNDDVSFGDLSDKGCESINSSTVSLASNKDTLTVTTGTRSWADLFKGRDSATVYNNATSVVSPQINSQSPQNDFSGDDSQTATVESSCKSLDAQTIALQEDPFVFKLNRKLKEIHLKHSLPFLVPRGFVNRGNWCYINATLQALLYCPPFYNLMREIGEISGICREKSCTPIIDSFAKFFSNFLPSEPMMKKLKSGPFSAEDLPTAEPFEPKCIYEVLGAIKSECLKGKQEDAEEFLSSVLNGLHDEMVMVFRHVESTENDVNANGQPVDEYETEKDSKINCDDDSALWKEVGPRHKALPMRSTNVVATPISDIFGGSILSVRTAGKDVCGNRQPFFTLQLDIQSEKIKSIEDALRSLTSSDSIQGYTCPKTKQTVDASYQSFLNQLPPILILHLKLFSYDKDGGSRKLLKKIEYPIDFELPRECINHDRSAEKNKYSKSYKLLAVVHHDGHESVKGHYVTDIFHIGSSLWLRCDDNTIKAVSAQQMLNPQPPRVPYLLFYRRCDTLRGHNQPQRGFTTH